MKLTPLDIHHKEFHHAIRGYSEEEVDAFLDEVAEEFERLFKENIDLAEKYEIASAKVREYQSMETTLNNTLVSAQRSAEQIVAQANEEAASILGEAESKKQQIIHSALTDKQRAQGELVRLKEAEQDFRARFRALLEEHLRGVAEVPLSPEISGILEDAPAAVPEAPMAASTEPDGIESAAYGAAAPAVDVAPVADAALEVGTSYGAAASAVDATPAADTGVLDRMLSGEALSFDEPVAGSLESALGAVEAPAGPESSSLTGTSAAGDAADDAGLTFVSSVGLGELEGPDFGTSEPLEEPREFTMPSFDAFGERDDDSDIEEID